jgi:hypothetical protein
MFVKLTLAEFQFVRDVLDEAREEFETLVRDEEWYVTELDEKCKEAYNILKYKQIEEEPKDAT